jgi:periplasmic copper chaperone A
MPSSLRVPAALCAAAVLATGSTAFAHVSLAGTGNAGQQQMLTFGVGHGCEGADTVRVEIAIPPEVTAVRALPSTFGEATLQADDAGIVTAVSWSKSEARPLDDQFYQLAIRIKVPETPFATLYFPARQTCRTAEGEEIVVAWDQLPEQLAEVAEGEETLPAPALTILPQHFPGWNKFTVPSAVDVLSVFDDAQIVWSGDSAYSSNPATQELIKSDKTVDALTKIKAGAEIWVKY